MLLRLLYMVCVNLLSRTPPRAVSLRDTARQRAHTSKCNDEAKISRRGNPKFGFAPYGNQESKDNASGALARAWGESCSPTRTQGLGLGQGSREKQKYLNNNDMKSGGSESRCRCRSPAFLSTSWCCAGTSPTQPIACSVLGYCACGHASAPPLVLAVLARTRLGIRRLRTSHRHFADAVGGSYVLLKERLTHIKWGTLYVTRGAPVVLAAHAVCTRDD
jgi:hypothetical protein